MDLCEHITGYNLALEYFPNCFNKNLKLRNDFELSSKISRRIEKLRRKKNIEYEDLLLGSKYVEYLTMEKEIFNSIRDIDVKSLYLRYDDTLRYGNMNGEGYNYYFLLTILKMPILRILESMDNSISSFPNNEKSKDIKAFIRTWNMLLMANHYGEYNYINLDLFISELNIITKDNPLLMGYNNVLEDALAQINYNSNVLKRK